MASMTLMKHTTQAACCGQVAHIYRERDSYGNPDIHPDLAVSNLYIGSADSCRQAIRDTISSMDKEKPPKRVKKDRKTVWSMNIPAPREDMSDDDKARFFRAVLSGLQENGYCISGAAIHADEVHDYIDSRDKQQHSSRWHMHVLGVPVTEEKGVNMSAWATRARYTEINKLLNQVCERELGYSYNDGSQRRYQDSVETLKARSALEAVRQLPELQQEIDARLSEIAALDAQKAFKATQIEEMEKSVSEIKKRQETANERLQEVQQEINRRESVATAISKHEKGKWMPGGGRIFSSAEYQDVCQVSGTAEKASRILQEAQEERQAAQALSQSAQNTMAAAKAAEAVNKELAKENETVKKRLKAAKIKFQKESQAEKDKLTEQRYQLDDRIANIDQEVQWRAKERADEEIEKREKQLEQNELYVERGKALTSAPAAALRKFKDELDKTGDTICLAYVETILDQQREGQQNKKEAVRRQNTL